MMLLDASLCPLTSHLFLEPVGHQRVLTLWVDVNQNQLTLLDGHQPTTPRLQRYKTRVKAFQHSFNHT